MTMTDTSHALWVAYGERGVAGSIRREAAEHIVTMSGAATPLGSYPSMEIAKRALHAHMPQGSDWPRFVQH